MFKTFKVGLEQRAVVFRHGLPRRALTPGRHRVWGTGLSLGLFEVSKLLFSAPEAVRAVMPTDWFREVTLDAHQRAVLWREGVPVAFLRAGMHRFFTLDRGVRLEVFDVREPAPALTAELARVIPASEVTAQVILDHQRALLLVSGRVERVLGPGRHVFWNTVDQPVQVIVVDLRTEQLTLTGQELMTRDKVTLRLTLTAELAIVDPVLAHRSAVSPRDVVWLAVQLAARDHVASVTLDQLLEGREALARALDAAVHPAAQALGLSVSRVGVKDIILPGEMKAILNRVIIAEKEAAANVILRREETAATRSLANTARVMAEQPMVMRLKELETLREIAAHVDKLQVIAPVWPNAMAALAGGVGGDALRASGLTGLAPGAASPREGRSTSS